MGKIAFVYPGQGSQQVGMGLDLYENAEIKKSMDNIFDSIGYSSYFRGGYIDQIQPRNFSAQINYKF